MSTIVLLSLTAMFGTALCIVFIIILIKRNSSGVDEENSHVTPSHDIAANNGTCALAGIPSLLLLVNINKGSGDRVLTHANGSENKPYSCNNGDVGNHFHQYNDGTIETDYDRLCQNSDRCHDSSHHNNGYDLRDDVNDTVVVMDSAHVPKQDRLSPPLPETNIRKTSDSESIVTTAKIIYVRDSSSSRSSSSNSNEQ